MDASVSKHWHNAARALAFLDMHKVICPDSEPIHQGGGNMPGERANPIREGGICPDSDPIPSGR
eukprot:5385854-Pyramimonas_sp.AAC.2